MQKWLFVVSLFFLASCSTTHYYVVRHAEKAPSDGMMTSDVPLSEQGKQRAAALERDLHAKNIKHIYSTPYLRTQGTAQPLSTLLGVPIQTYKPGDAAFLSTIKALKDNVLVVGHSNTVDDIINSITGESLLKDLPETQYGDLFIIKKRGGKYSFSQKRFGE